MESIGRYEIQRELGRGAMGVVYLAHDPRLHRQVAVKTYALPDGISEELAKEFHERFLREARAAAGLSHPGIVTIHDAGEDPTTGRPYIAMEFVPGESLREHLVKGERFEPSWVYSMGVVLAQALHAAHLAGIVHRDIKPANILIREGDRAAKIADFGVARLKSSDLTQSGASIGSPGYMSPEQVRGGALDGRSDLFSLAVVLYEALCGKRPFAGEDLVSLAYSIAHDTQVPLSRQARGFPAGMDDFFDRALSKDPDRRFPDGEAFARAFLIAGNQRSPERLNTTVVDAATLAADASTRAIGARADGEPPAPAPQPARGGRRRRLVLTLGSVALLAGGLAGAAYLTLSRPLPARAASRDAVAPSQPVTGLNRGGPAPGAPARRDAAAGRQASLEPGRGVRPEASARQETNVRTGNGSPAAPGIRQTIQLTVPAGTEVRLALDAAVSSSSSRAGDPLTARISSPVVTGDRVAIPAGSTVRGHVREAIPARKGLSGKGGSLTLSFDEVVTPSGFRASMSAVLTSAAPASAGKTAGTIGGSAAGGALLGKILGGKTKDAVAGSVIGAAVGTGIAASAKGQDVEIPRGSPLTVTLDQSIVIPSQP